VEDSALYQFNHKGIIYCSDIDGKAASEEILEEAITHAIDSGADDVAFLPDHPEYGNVLEFSTSPTSFFKVKQALETMKYHIVHGDVDYIPNNVLDLGEGEIEEALKLYQKISDLPDVAKVSANIA
jgi:transcriptional/translational regulatory protein YebC/TACO1